MNITNVFDLQQIYVNELFGDTTLFMIVGLVFIWIICIKKGIPYQIATALSVVLIMITYTIILETMYPVYVLTIASIAGALGYQLYKLVRG